MKLPLEIVARGFTLPKEMRDEIEALTARLDHFYHRIMRARVTIERSGHLRAWALRIALTVPGGSVLVNRQKGQNLPEALREAFDAATRRLEDYARRRRGDVKTHATEAS